MEKYQRIQGQHAAQGLDRSGMRVCMCVGMDDREWYNLWYRFGFGRRFLAA